MMVFERERERCAVNLNVYRLTDKPRVPPARPNLHCKSALARFNSPGAWLWDLDSKTAMLCTRGEHTTTTFALPFPANDCLLSTKPNNHLIFSVRCDWL